VTEATLPPGANAQACPMMVSQQRCAEAKRIPRAVSSGRMETHSTRHQLRLQAFIYSLETEGDGHNTV